MTKFNNDNVSQCLVHCLKQTKLKYDEALVHSSDLSKHGTFLMWKITKMRKLCPFFFSQKFCITHLINSLLQTITVGFWVYSHPDFVVRSKRHSTGFKFPTPPPPQSNNRSIRVLTRNDILLLLQTFIVLLFFGLK